MNKMFKKQIYIKVALKTSQIMTIYYKHRKTTTKLQTAVQIQQSRPTQQIHNKVLIQIPP